MAKLGDIEFVLLDESRAFDSQVSSYSVEDGADITDHVSLEQPRYNINGKVAEEDAGEKHSAMLRLRRTREPFFYAGRSAMGSSIMESFSTSVDVGIANGFTFTATLRQIKVSKPSTVGLRSPALRADTSEIGNAGRVQVQ